MIASNGVLRVAGGAGSVLVGVYVADLARRGFDVGAALVGVLAAVAFGAELGSRPRPCHCWRRLSVRGLAAARPWDGLIYATFGLALLALILLSRLEPAGLAGSEAT